MSLRDREILRKLSRFGPLGEEQLQRLAPAAATQRLARGGVLFEEGERPDFLHVLLEGAVALSGRAATAGQEAVVEILWPVDAFIAAAVLTDTPYLMTARALEDSRVLLLDAEALRAASREDAAIGRLMLSLFAGHYRRLVRQIKDLKLRTAGERLGCFLLRLADEAGSEGRVRLPFSKAVLASRLGMTPESLSRAFRQLESSGLEVRGGDIVIRDRARLELQCKPYPLIDGVEAGVAVPDH